MIINGNGQIVGTYPAANNAQSGSRGPWDPGVYNFDYWKPHSPDSNGPYGLNGNFVFEVPGCEGCGVHSGRKDRCDKAGRCGVDFATNGCIRTTDDATDLIRLLNDSGDSLKTLTVK